MKKFWIFALIAVFTLAMTACSDDDDNNDNGNDVVLDQLLEATFEALASDRQVYLTTVGQTEDVDILWNVFGQVFDSTNERDATIIRDSVLEADAVEEGAFVLIAPGASSKGMGAAGVDQASELDRANAFAARAAAGEITLVMVHSGGMQRRGPLSDPMIEAAAREAVLMLVLNAGNTDGFFNTLHTTHSVPLYVYSSNPSLVPPFKQLFDK